MKTKNNVHIFPAASRTKPHYTHIARAVNYWVLLDDLAAYFKKADMPEVGLLLDAACAEIDRIWQDGDYESGQHYKC